MTKRKIGKLYDGDSGTFANGENFRLANVRAPETGRKDASSAKRALAGMLGRSSNSVNVKEVGRDKYGRTLVKFSNSDGSINQRMRDKGYSNRGR